MKSQHKHMEIPPSPGARLAVERRGLLRVAASAACAALIGAFAPNASAAAPPKEAGLSFEGLLHGKPGFQPRKPAPLALGEIPGFLSQRQLAQNYEVYRESFDRLLGATRALSSAPRDAAHAAQYAALRKQQVEAGNSVLLHEFYFRNLSARPARPSAYLLANMTEHMGTLASWQEDFAACARVAGAWSVLAYDPYDDRWHNVPLGETDAGGWIGSNPLVVCDVAEHAWSLDYRDRETYIARFFEHIDWRVVAARYHAVDRH